MANSSSLSSSTCTNPERIWHADTDSMLDEVISIVSSGVSDATDALVYSVASVINSPSTDGVREFMAAIAPTLSKQLSRLRRVMQRNVFYVPPGVDVPALEEAIKYANRDKIDAEEAVLDAEIAAVRAQIRDTEIAIRELGNMKESAAQHLSLMKGLSEDLETSSVAKLSGNIAELVNNTNGAEKDFVAGANILKAHRIDHAKDEQDPLLRAASNTLSKSKNDHSDVSIADRVFGENLMCNDEHGPLQHFVPSAQSILKISLGGESEKLKELSTLRARLLG